MSSSGFVSHHPSCRSIVPLHDSISFILDQCCNVVYSLRRRALDKLNTLGDVATQALVAGLEESLLVLVRTADDVDGLLGTTGLLGKLVKPQDMKRR